MFNSNNNPSTFAATVGLNTIRDREFVTYTSMS